MLDVNAANPEDQVEEHRSAAPLYFQRWAREAERMVQYIEGCNLLGLIPGDAGWRTMESIIQASHAVKAACEIARDGDHVAQVFPA